jgi:hypothetical protein
MASCILQFIFRCELLKSCPFLLAHEDDDEDDEDDVLLPTSYHHHSLILTLPSIFITATYRGTDRLVVIN